MMLSLAITLSGSWSQMPYPFVAKESCMMTLLEMIEPLSQALIPELPPIMTFLVATTTGATTFAGPEWQLAVDFTRAIRRLSASVTSPDCTFTVEESSPPTSISQPVTCSPLPRKPPMPWLRGAVKSACRKITCSILIPAAAEPRGIAPNGLSGPAQLPST